MARDRHTDHPYPRSERTIFPRRYQRPLVGRRFDEAKEAEAVRAKHDPMYIPADEARALPQEVLDRPEVREKVRYSQPDWPETRSTASRALGELPTGCGEVVERRDVPAESLFGGGRVEGDE